LGEFNAFRLIIKLLLAVEEKRTECVSAAKQKVFMVEWKEKQQIAVSLSADRHKLSHTQRNDTPCLGIAITVHID